MKKLEDLDVDPTIEGRNAVMAEKAEVFIAPLLRKKLGRKPKIYFRLGTAHIGIEDYLKDENLRREIVGMFHPLENYFESAGLRDVGELNIKKGVKYLKIHENTINPEKVTSVEKHSAATHKRKPFFRREFPMRARLGPFSRLLDKLPQTPRRK